MDDTDLQLRIENVVGGLRTWGYRVKSTPVFGEEAAYYEALKAGLRRVDAAVDHLHTKGHSRGRSQRTLRLLHSALPEPCWGVEAVS